MVVVTVERAFQHCPKALVRSNLWKLGERASRPEGVPTLGDFAAARQPDIDSAVHEPTRQAHARTSFTDPWVRCRQETRALAARRAPAPPRTPCDARLGKDDESACGISPASLRVAATGSMPRVTPHRPRPRPGVPAARRCRRRRTRCSRAARRRASNIPRVTRHGATAHRPAPAAGRDRGGRSRG